MWIKKATIFFLFCLLVGNAPAQSNMALNAQGYEAMQNKDWYGAQQYYQRLYARDSSNLKVKFNYAEASRQVLDLDVALRLFREIALLDNGRRFPLSYYRLAECLQYKGHYKEAKSWFLKYSRLKRIKRKDGLYRIKAKIQAEACDLAQILIANPVISFPGKFDRLVNTSFSEYAPVQADSTLYYSSLKEPEARGNVKQSEFSKIFMYRMDSRKRKVVALDTLVNANGYHNANTCFSPDYKKMIFSRCTAKNGSEYLCELFESNYLNKKWQLAASIGEPVNIPQYSSTQPCFGLFTGKEALYFSSDRPGGMGGMDIWISIINESGTFEVPINAGKNVNTPGDEVTPWFADSAGTLYFSSSWLKGLGGFDIFKSRLRDSIFSVAENVGYPVNSSYNDLYFSTAGKHMYISSNRVGSTFENNKLNCCSDIYRFTAPDTLNTISPVDSTVIARERLKLLVPLTLYFHNDEPDPATRNVQTLKSYETTYKQYKNLLPEYAAGFSKGSKDKKEDITEVENFFSDSVDAGMDALTQFADLLEKCMINGETVSITMKGYCSPLASSDYNINLAKRRISSLRNYFRTAKNGLFNKYINNKSPSGARIIFEDVEIGELTETKVSDDIKDKRNSVYSPNAASERKIQIIAVSFVNK
jgi:hypothetical protein